MFMKNALKEAQKASNRGEIPVGAVIVCDGKIISTASNKVEELKNPLAHAEILAIQEACRVLNRKFLTDCDIYVSLEPCDMCAKAISLARIRRVYFGAYDTKKLYQTKNHTPDVYGGICETECMDLIQGFFKTLRG